MALIVNPLSDLAVKDTETTTVNLFNNFDDSLTTGLVARFELFNSTLGGGVTQVVLFDQAGSGAPLTVQNFRNYINNGSYSNSIIHRSVPGFVVQGGGFTANGLSTVLAQTPNSGAAAVQAIPTNPPVQNEFSLQRSNLRGTIAMAKLGSDPNSATNQWFFNLADNAANLDNQNGGFTVFGQVLSAADLAPLDAIVALPRFNGSTFFGQSAFTNLPMQVSDPANPVVSGDENFVRYRSISLSQMSELQFAVVNNSNPSLVDATIKNNQLVLSYHSAPTKTAEITVRAINLLGQSIEDTFLVTVEGSVSPVSPAINTPTAGSDTLVGTEGDDVTNGLGGDDWLSGRGGNDRLLGQDGADTLMGDAGNDILQGGIGRDKITTGKGRDTIVMSRKDRFDIVKDFSDRRDRIRLIGGLSFGQLSFHQRGKDTIVQAGKTNLLMLENFHANALSRADFVS